MAVASLDDVKQALRRDLDPDSEAPFIDGMLTQVEARLLVRIPDLQPRTTVGDKDYNEHFVTLVKGVEAEAVARVLRAPNNGIYRTETEGNYSYGMNYQVASGLLDILDDEWERLGVGGGAYGMVAPNTDGYLATRANRYLPPAQRFQTEFGVPSSLSRQF